MRERMLELEKESASLEPSPEERARIRRKVVDYTEEFLNKVNELKAYHFTEDKGKEIMKAKITDEAQDIDELIKLVADNVDRPGLNPASGGHLGYIPGGGIYHSALGDYMADITNRYAGVFFASPGAVRMENTLLSWMGEMVGYDVKKMTGNLTSGGSMANLIGIITAREAHQVKAKDIEKTVVYISQQVHHSVDKAFRVVGLGECIKHYIPLDSGFRMIPEKLDQAIAEDKKKGLIPWLIIASAGTTDVGAVDPLLEIGKISKKHQLWFHIDGAYGAFFALTEEGKKKLAGMELSDSIIMDPHKGLFLPYGSGAVLVKDGDRLRDAHYYLANYMQDTLQSNEEMSPADLSPELTKHFRGMRLWLPLKALGLKPFKAALEEKLLLTQYFYEEVQKIGFEVGPYPDLSVATYRYVPKNGDPDQFNEKLVHKVQQDGRIFISSTILNGKFTLRLAVLVFRTHLAHIDLTLQILKEKVEEVLKEQV